ncbi:hypothetical protein N7495_008209 [Penicillium taxi]|uniref:uncharacterized protein n=1 Tax=Penicillium taxi TaxID=168475 RepID=UPI0025451162|nr:uncharacterized protein N7495_008209 [Penicillium taxi]KAJ5888168.1 hypothetical protein N7495_008209 [Penicillium taxi]
MRRPPTVILLEEEEELYSSLQRIFLNELQAQFDRLYINEQNKRHHVDPPIESDLDASGDSDRLIDFRDLTGGSFCAGNLRSYSDARIESNDSIAQSSAQSTSYRADSTHQDVDSRHVPTRRRQTASLLASRHQTPPYSERPRRHRVTWATESPNSRGASPRYSVQQTSQGDFQQVDSLASLSNR